MLGHMADNYNYFPNGNYNPNDSAGNAAYQTPGFNPSALMPTLDPNLLKRKSFFNAQNSDDPNDSAANAAYQTPGANPNSMMPVLDKKLLQRTATDNAANAQGIGSFIRHSNADQMMDIPNTQIAVPLPSQVQSPGTVSTDLQTRPLLALPQLPANLSAIDSTPPPIATNNSAPPMPAFTIPPPFIPQDKQPILPGLLKNISDRYGTNLPSSIASDPGTVSSDVTTRPLLSPPNTTSADGTYGVPLPSADLIAGAKSVDAPPQIVTANQTGDSKQTVASVPNSLMPQIPAQNAEQALTGGNSQQSGAQNSLMPNIPLNSQNTQSQIEDQYHKDFSPAMYLQEDGTISKKKRDGFMVRAPGKDHNKDYSWGDKIKNAVQGLATGGVLGAIDAVGDRDYSEKHEAKDKIQELTPQIQQEQQNEGYLMRQQGRAAKIQTELENAKTLQDYRQAQILNQQKVEQDRRDKFIDGQIASIRKRKYFDPANASAYDKQILAQRNLKPEDMGQWDERNPTIVKWGDSVYKYDPATRAMVDTGIPKDQSKSLMDYEVLDPTTQTSRIFRTTQEKGAQLAQQAANKNMEVRLGQQRLAATNANNDANRGQRKDQFNQKLDEGRKQQAINYMKEWRKSQINLTGAEPSEAEANAEMDKVYKKLSGNSYQMP